MLNQGDMWAASKHMQRCAAVLLRKYKLILQHRCSKKTYLAKCWWGHRVIGALTCCCCDCKTVYSLLKTVWQFIRKLDIHPPYHPTILLLVKVVIYPREMKAYVCTQSCIWIFIGTSFVISSNWKQLKSHKMVNG